MPSNVLVIVIDGLRASALGAYGNTSFPSPALDRCAAESLLMDWCYAPSVDLPDIYRALWHSQKSTRPRDNRSRDAGNCDSTSLPKVFDDAGWSTTLVTDEPSLSSYTAAADFDEIVPVSSSTQSNSTGERAHASSETGLARAFAVVDTVSRIARDKSHLIWFHARGMYGPWDAPLELQQLLLDEDDPPPVELTAPPELFVTPRSDPDAVFRYSCAYAAQVMVLDECLRSLLNTNNAFAGDERLILLIGARGLPLGEHGRIGGVDPRTHAEQLHVPWMIRFPDRRGQLARVAALTSHIDVLPTLIDWIEVDRTFDRSAFDGASILPFASAASVSWRDAAISTTATGRSIRTAAWCLREDIARDDSASSSEAISRSELYVRPDDRWEANDVAKLCPDVVDELRTAITSTL